MDTGENNNKSKGKRVAVIILKTFLWLIGIPLFLLTAVFVALQFPGPQKFATGKATGFLSGKIKTKVTLGEINFAFPKSIALTDLYLEDQQGDTLLYSHLLQADLDLWKLLDKKIELNAVTLETLTGHIYRNTPNGDFNFSFIPAAFASSDTIAQAPADTAAVALQFSIKNVSLKNIYFTYHDRSSGMNADLNLGAFDAGFDQFDLDKKIIRIGTVALKNTRAVVVQNTPLYKAPEDTAAARPFDYDLALDKLELNNITASYSDKVALQNLDVKLGRFLLEPKEIDIKNEKIALKTVLLHGTEIYYTQNKTAVVDTIVTKIEEVTEKKPNWVLTLGNLDLENNTIGFNNGNKAPLASGIDFNHLLAKNIILKASDIDASASRVSVNLKNMALQEQSGFVLKKFRSKITYDSTHADLANLEIRANNTVIKDHLGVRYSSLSALADSIGSLGLAIDLNKTSLAVKDILLFVPDLYKTLPLKNNAGMVINISGKVAGKINDLSISKFELSTLQQTTVKLNGSIKNVMDPKNMYASLSAFEIKSSKKDLAALLPDTLIPKDVSIPESFAVKGAYKGYMKNFDADVAVNTSIGTIAATVKMNPRAGNKEQPYSGKIDITEFDLGKLLNQPQTLGPLTMSASAKGSGFDTSNLNVAISAGIAKATFKNYAYSNFQLDGTMIKKSFNGKAVMKDKNLDFTFTGGADLEPAHPKYTFTLDLAGVDLKALNLSEEDVRISAVISSDIGNEPGRNVTGRASIKNALIIKNNRKYPVDSIVLTSEFKDGVSDLRLRSEIMTADFNGDISLKELPATLTQQINSYFNLQQQTLTAVPAAKQKFKFSINLVDPTLLTNNLVPGLEKLTPAAVTGAYDSEAKSIQVNMSVPQIVYSGITVDSLKVDVSSDAAKLNYDVKIAEVSNPTLKFENVFLGGELKQNTLSFKFNTAKDDSAKLLAIGGLLKSVNREFELKLDKDLVLNAENWNIDGSNYLMFSKQGMYANNVAISNGRQSLSLNSRQKIANAPLEINFKSFDISTVSKLIENKKDLLKGNIDGSVILEQQNNAPAFKSDLVISNFVFQAVPVGTIKLKADNFENPNKYQVDLGIEGSGNDIAMKGYYNAGKDNNLNFILDIRNLELKTIEPFTFKQVTRMSGSLAGKLTLQGPASLPDINGTLAFKNAAFNPGIIDSYLKVEDSKLVFDSKKIRFNNFVLRDSLNQKGSIDGVVDLQDINNIKLDLRVKTDNFLALNTTKKSNPLYYGTVFLDSDIRIRGTSSAPTLDVKAKLNKGSAITYVKPESEIGKNESKGIVEFENNNPDKNIAIMARQNDSIAGISEVKGIELNASINVDRSVQLKMIVDPISGDSLFILGGGLLDFSLDRSGKTSLSGKYNINDGGYFLSLENLVKRSFKIQKGSSVTWSGDLLDAYVDLTAIYTIKTSPIDLVQNELAGVSEFEKNKYRNLLTFNVYLKMTGFISAPEISFDIQLAPGDRGANNGAVNTKLAQLREDETQLNKQVFALLTLRRFIGENPLESGSEGGLSSASRSSASQVLTQQLSSLSSKYVNFVDLDLGVNSFEDYSSGQEQGRTQLQVGVSKQLFKDKVTVRVGGNVDLEGEKASQNSVNDVAGNVSLDYKLTEDGRYKLKGFRENQYENPIEGELTKTGVGIVFTRNFNTFKQLFKAPKKQPAKPKEEPKKNEEKDAK